MKEFYKKFSENFFIVHTLHTNNSPCCLRICCVVYYELLMFCLLMLMIIWRRSLLPIHKMNLSISSKHFFSRYRLAKENGKKRNEVTACMLTKWVMHKLLVPENILFYMSKETGGLILTARKFARLHTLISADNLRKHADNKQYCGFILISSKVQGWMEISYNI